MRTALFLAAGALAWYLVGFLSVCIANIFDGPVSHERWLKDRMINYNLAFLGPLVTFGLVIWLFISIIKIVVFFFNVQKIFPSIIKISDWMIAGFRKPPTPPATKDDEIPDFPTVSP